MKPIKIEDFPKIESPFVREMRMGEYIVTSRISLEYEWVFTDDKVIAVEKLDGTNVSILIQDGVITSVWNRTERIPFFNKGKKWLIEGVLNSYERGYMEFLADGQHFGELIGPKVNGNPYKLEEHVWIPFATYAREHLAYKSFGRYPKSFESFNDWFHGLIPLYAWKIHSKEKVDKRPDEFGFVEGVVFTHPDGRMAKLRKDMFP